MEPYLIRVEDVHRACMIDREMQPIFSHELKNDPEGIEALIAELALMEADNTTVALDLLGGLATLLCATLAKAGYWVVHTPRRSAAALAAAAGIATGLRQSGKSRAIRRSTSDDKTLKRVFFQSAFNGWADSESRALYVRKHAVRMRRDQPVIALARRRANVVWTCVQTRTPFTQNYKQTA